MEDLTESLIKFKQGNNHALDSVFKHFRTSLYFVAYKHLRDTEKAKDVVQEVFLKLLKLSAIKRNTYLPDNASELHALLYVITKNKALDETKVTNNRLKLLHHFFANSKTEYDDAHAKEELLPLILTKLPKREGEILKLHIDGHKNEEITQMLNISYNTVRNTLSESKKKAQHYWKLFDK